jgi:hypothetical protein
MSVAEKVEHVGNSEKTQDNTGNSEDRIKAKHEYSIKFAFGVERKY